MAVKASVTITISKYRDTDSITRYYKLQASTASIPAKPTTLIPNGWTDTEPTYDSGSTNTLYIVDRYIFSDGTFQYTEVSKSTSYEAAKEAYNKAIAAQTTATEITNRVNDKENNYGYKFHMNIYVKGETNKFYPFIIKCGDQSVKRHIFIKRIYNEQAPADWYNASQPGGLSVLIACNFGRLGRIITFMGSGRSSRI